MPRWRRVVLLRLLGALVFMGGASPSIATGPATRPPPPPRGEPPPPPPRVQRPPPPPRGVKPPPPPPRVQRPPPPQAGVARRPSQRDVALEGEIYELVNRHRRERGLEPLTLDARISEQALRHSVAMATGRAPVGHQGFEDRIRALRQVMTFGWSAENAGMNDGYAHPAQQMMAGWLASPAHRVNIEGRYDFTGIGVTWDGAGKIYCTQIFISR